MANVGFASLCLALGLGSILSFVRLHWLTKKQTWLVYQGLLFSLSLSFFVLITGFILNDFSMSSVAEHSHSQQSLLYKIAAVWSHHEGSFLFLSWLMSFLPLCDLRRWLSFTDKQTKEYFRIMGRILTLWIGYSVIFASPFREVFEISSPGGLNPLLQDQMVIIHPPILYVGYALTFYLLGLGLLGRQNLHTIALLSFGFLSMGITLGSYWAFTELGWGGWWFWDPVETLSLLPWLVTGALLHRLKGSKMFSFLPLLPALSVLLGFVVIRSGAVQSVHSFAFDEQRGYSLLFLIIGFGAMTLTARSQVLRQAPFTKDIFQKIAFWGFIVCSFILLLGSLTPPIFSFVQSKNIELSRHFFDTLSTFIGIGILISLILFEGKPFWRKKNIIGLLVFVLCGATSLLWTLPSGSIPQNLILSLSCALIILCFWKFCQVPHFRLWVHSGIAIAALGMALETQGRLESSVVLKQGETAEIHHPWNLTFQNLTPLKTALYEGARAKISLNNQNTQAQKTFLPERRRYFSQNLLTSESGQKFSFPHAFLVHMGDKTSDHAWFFEFSYHPWVFLIWIGGTLIFIGSILVAIKHET